MLVLRTGRQHLVGTLSHHVCDALAVVAFLWLGGQSALLGVMIQTSTVITTVDVGGIKQTGYRWNLPLDGSMIQEMKQKGWRFMFDRWKKEKCGHGLSLHTTTFLT